MTTNAEKVKCPECGSENVAEILWGEPALSEQLAMDLNLGKIYLGGCTITDDSCEFHCNNCGCEFDSIWD